MNDPSARLSFAGSRDQGASAEPARRPLPSRLRALVPAGLLALHLVLLLTSVSRKAATVDEFAHVPAGVHYWRTGEFSLSGLNPPLAKLWTALPVLLMRPAPVIAAEPVLRSAEYPWEFGRVFLRKNWREWDAMLFGARASVMALSVLTGLLLFLWARRLMGFAAASLALAIYALEPNTIAHGRLATQDTALMLAALLTLYLLDAVIERGRWWRVALLGLALGAACLVKFSGLILALAMPVVFAACVAFVRDFRLPLRAPIETRFRAGRLRAAWQSLVVLAAVALVALVVINAVYAFRGACRRLDPAKLQSRAMQSFAAGPLGWVPVPLPADYVAGLDGQQAGVERGETDNYLNGRWSLKGEWYYYLEAFALKVPIPVLALMLLGIVSVFVVRPERKATAWVLLVTGALFWAMHSFGANKQLGLRYLLPLFPLAFLLAARPALMAAKLAGRARVAFVVLLAALVAWSAADALAIHPDYLAYFNPIAGGPDGGPRYLLDSNIDWGQDLPGLADYLRKEGYAGPVYFGYFGEDAPERWGLEPRQVFRGVKGVVAVSVNYLYGMRYRTYSFTDWAVYVYQANYFGWLRREKPVAVIGHTIYVYRTDRE